MLKRFSTIAMYEELVARRDRAAAELRDCNKGLEALDRLRELEAKQRALHDADEVMEEMFKAHNAKRAGPLGRGAGPLRAR